MYHILNGDCLAVQLRAANIQGEQIICRECLIDGNLQGESLNQFWATRADVISASYHDTTTHYFEQVVTEFNRIINLPEQAIIHLWFEDDLFCQTNMWFILSLLAARKTEATVFRIFPTPLKPVDHWQGFGPSNAAMLNQSLARKVPFTKQDINLGNQLWTAYKKGDFDTLIRLSQTPSPCFRFLKEVCQAHIDRFPPDGSLSRPEILIKELSNTIPGNFDRIFSEFSKREGIYGFGDLQVKNLYDKLLK